MKVKRNSETLHMCKCHADELIAYNDLKNIYIKQYYICGGEIKLRLKK